MNGSLHNIQRGNPRIFLDINALGPHHQVYLHHGHVTGHDPRRVEGPAVQQPRVRGDDSRQIP